MLFRSLQEEGKDLVEDIFYPFSTNDFNIKGKDWGVMAQDYPWRKEYVFSPELTLEQFLSWRSFFKVIKDRFANPVGAEIGVFEGYLSKFVLKYLNPKIYYLIDPYKEYKDTVGDLNYPQETWDMIYSEVTKRFFYHPNVILVRKSSIEASKDIPDDSLDFVYIDGNHSPNSVYGDIVSWFPKVGVGGVIGGHDIIENTVKSGLYRFLVENKEKDYEIKSGFNDWWIEKS